MTTRPDSRSIPLTFPQVNVTNPCLGKSRLALSTCSFSFSNITDQHLSVRLILVRIFVYHSSILIQMVRTINRYLRLIAFNFIVLQLSYPMNGLLVMWVGFLLIDGVQFLFG